MSAAEKTTMQSGKHKSGVSGPVAAIVICLVIVACALPYLWSLRPVKPPTQPTTMPETPAQIQQNAKFIKALQTLPPAKRGAYFGAHQNQSRQAALSPDPAQRKAVYALVPK